MVEEIIEYLNSVNCHADYPIEEIADDIYSMIADEFEKKIARIFDRFEDDR